MNIKLHPLIQETKVELLKLDKLKRISWAEQVKYNSKFLPISVEPKLRSRAFRFMNDLIKLIESNGHSIKFELNRCHIEMYGQLTEINLRQKYFRKRIKDSSGYGTDTYEKSNKLEFQVGSYARKGWIDKKTKSLEDYLPAIYKYIDNDSREWADLREKQEIERKENEVRLKLEAKKAELVALERAKLENLITDSKNYNIALNIRAYIKVLETQIDQNVSLNTISNRDYIKWARKKANDIDPIFSLLKS